MTESKTPRSLRDLTRVLFAHCISILVIVVILTGGTYIACTKAQKAFTSTVTFQARQPRLRNPTAQNVSPDRSLSVFIKTQQTLVTSDTVLLRTLVLLTDKPLRERWEAERGKLKDPKADITSFAKAVADLDASAQKRLEGAAPDDAQFREDFRDLCKRVKVETPGGADVISMSEILNISVTRKGMPSDARDAADILARCYVDRYREVGAGSSNDAVAFSQSQLAGYERNVLEPAEKAVNDFVAKELESPADLVILEQLSKAGTEAGRQIVVRRFQEETIVLDGQIATSRQLQLQLLQQGPAAMMPASQPAGDAKPVVPDAAAVMKLPDDVLKLAVLIIPDDVIKSNEVIASLKKKEVELIVKRNRLEVEFQDAYRELVDVNT